VEQALSPGSTVMRKLPATAVIHRFPATTNKYKLPALLGVFLACALPAAAQHGGGGGHAGGGGLGGHSMGSSGHSVGQAISHSVGHVFGSHSRGPRNSEGRRGGEEPPLAGAAMVHGRIVQLPGPGGARGVRPIRPNRPLTVFGFRQRQGFFGYGDLGFCSPFEGFFTGYGFGSPYDCGFSDFYFDPYSGDGYAPDFDGGDPEQGSDAAAYDAAPLTEFHPDVILENEEPAPVDKVPHHRRSPHEPDTILQLKDGSMYGLRDYWVTDGRLYYIANYGGQNSVALSQIDLEKTVELNGERGEKFTLQPQSVASN
jgi:hypothetical protein